MGFAFQRLELQSHGSAVHRCSPWPRCGEGGIILLTSDGGAHWGSVPSGVTEMLNAVEMATPTVGIADGDDGTIVRTSDGGVTWSVSIRWHRDDIVGGLFCRCDTWHHRRAGWNDPPDDRWWHLPGDQQVSNTTRDPCMKWISLMCLPELVVGQDGTILADPGWWSALGSAVHGSRCVGFLRGPFPHCTKGDRCR